MREYIQRIRQASRKSDLAEIHQAFARLDAAFGSFANKGAPWDITIRRFFNTAPLLTAWKFNDVYEARSCLFDLSRWLLLIRHQMYRAWFRDDMATFNKYATEKENIESAHRELAFSFQGCCPGTQSVWGANSIDAPSMV